MIFDKLKKNKTEFRCFYDSEFNAYDDNKNLNIPQEIVSIGICITNEKGAIIEKFYSLIALKVAKRITNRCTEITGIKTKDLKNAANFVKICDNITKLIKKYHIEKIYCYGAEDKRNLDKTNELYDKKAPGNFISKRLYDARQDFKKKTKGKVGDQGLSFLKSICKIDGGVAHDALQDAIDLANVYHKLNSVGYDEKVYIELSKEREEISSYKRTRRIKEENAQTVPKELVHCKNKLVEYLEKNDIPNMNNGERKAIIDDLNLLFMCE